jgi:hypothetical protein
VCAALYRSTVTIISRIIVTILLYREITIVKKKCFENVEKFRHKEKTTNEQDGA